MYNKIDLFFQGNYICSTNSSKTCKEAKQKYIESLKTTKLKLSEQSKLILKNEKLLKANFDKYEKSYKRIS